MKKPGLVTGLQVELLTVLSVLVDQQANDETDAKRDAQ